MNIVIAIKKKKKYIFIAVRTVPKPIQVLYYFIFEWCRLVWKCYYLENELYNVWNLILYFVIDLLCSNFLFKLNCAYFFLYFVYLKSISLSYSQYILHILHEYFKYIELCFAIFSGLSIRLFMAICIIHILLSQISLYRIKDLFYLLY